MRRAWSFANATLLLAGCLNAAPLLAASASDQLDELDREAFQSSLSRAQACSREGDYACASKQLKRAKGFVVDPTDNEALKRAWAQLELDKRQVFSDQARSKYAAEQDNLAAKTQATQHSNEELAYYNRQQATENTQRIAEQQRQAPRPLSMTESVQAGMAQVQRDHARINDLHNEAMHGLREQQRRNAASAPAPTPQPARSASTAHGPKPEPRYDQAAPATTTAREPQSPAQATSHTLASTGAPATKTVAAKPSSAPTPEALAFCWKSAKGYWFCDGRVDETSIGDKNLDAQLSGVGCKQPRRLGNGELTLTSLRVKKRSPQTGWVYGCGDRLKAGDTGAATWNRDIRRFWQGIPF